MVNRRFYHKIIIVILIFTIFTTSCFASTTSNMIDGMKNLSTIDEIYNYIKTTFGSDGSNVTNSFLNGILQAINKRLSTPQNIVWVDFATRNIHGVSGDLSDYLYRDSNTQTSIYSKLNEFYNRYYTYSDGNASLLNQINTNTVNMYGSQSATNTQLANLNQKSLIQWTSCCEFLGVRKSYDGEYITASAPNGTIGQSYAYAVYKLNNGNFNSNKSSNMFRVFVPLAGYWDPNRNGSYTINMYIRYPHNGNRYIFTPDAINCVQLYDGLLITFTGITPMWAGSEFIVAVNNSYDNSNLLYYSSTPYFDYIPMTDKSYFDAITSLYAEKIANKDNQSEIVEAINNKTIEAELDNSIGTDDIHIDENLPSGGLLDSARVITRVKSQFGTNVSVLDFLSNYNVSDLSGWFSTDNANVVQSINSSYTDLYD